MNRYNKINLQTDTYNICMSSWSLDGKNLQKDVLVNLINLRFQSVFIVKIHKGSIEFYCMKLSCNPDGLKREKKKKSWKIWNRYEEFQSDYKVGGHILLFETALTSGTNGKFRRFLKPKLNSTIFQKDLEFTEGFFSHSYSLL